MLPELIVAGLLAWSAVLLRSVLARRRSLSVTFAPRPQHYVQACAQGIVFLYWGWYWRPVYDAAPLLAAQLLFAYAFDMFLSWSRRDVYALGFGPVPVVFSINLFLWFKPEWFYIQFLMVAVGLAAKELIRWDRDGRRTHIFNPSALPLALVSLALILTGTSDMTRGHDIAVTQFFPPHMYIVLFLVGLPAQFLFGVTSMTMSAVVMTYVAGLAYFAATGTYVFYDSYIPIAVFLGMHLLFTDPSTSPRTELGRIVFGALYGLSSIALYVLLERAGGPTFYDKLLQVPLLNLSVTLIDRAARSSTLRAFDPATLGRTLAPRWRNAAYMGVWAAVFAVMSAAQGIGDDHQGQWLPFWQNACDQGRGRACDYLAKVETMHCNSGSGWACNEAGILYATVDAADRSGSTCEAAFALFERGCDLGVAAACRNISSLSTGGTPAIRARPALADWPILLRGSKSSLAGMEPPALLARACRQGWPYTCGSANATSAASLPAPVAISTNWRPDRDR